MAQTLVKISSMREDKQRTLQKYENTVINDPDSPFVSCSMPDRFVLTASTTVRETEMFRQQQTIVEEAKTAEVLRERKLLTPLVIKHLVKGNLEEVKASLRRAYSFVVDTHKVPGKIQ